MGNRTKVRVNEDRHALTASVSVSGHDVRRLWGIAKSGYRLPQWEKVAYLLKESKAESLLAWARKNPGATVNLRLQGPHVRASFDLTEAGFAEEQPAKVHGVIGVSTGYGGDITGWVRMHGIDRLTGLLRQFDPAWEVDYEIVGKHRTMTMFNALEELRSAELRRRNR
jgi:hypothetical protein